MYVLVVTTSKSSAIGRGLWYESLQEVQLGALVRVSLRKSVVEGIIVDVRSDAPSGISDVKPIVQVLHEAFLPAVAVEVAKKLADDCHCSLRQALTLWLPGGVWSRSAKGLQLRSSNKQLVDAGIHLTEAQKAVVSSVLRSHKPTLLFGVTGSGKTEVYLSLIEEMLRRGKSSIVLVPEIFLSQQLVERISSVFPSELVAVVHSKQSAATLKKTWKEIRTGEKRIVIGPRSALFSPVSDLGLVVLDEEHEWTYKSEQTPRYHARNVAEDISNLLGARVVLGSATPSVESWWKAKNGVYALERLTERYGAASLPHVSVVDLADSAFGSFYPFTATLIEAIRKRLLRKEQCVLLLNRRGSATALLCMDCRRRVSSPISQLPFAVHYSAGVPYLYDHTSDTRLPLPEQCPHCKGSRLHEVGAGTQKIEVTVKKLFPGARVLRADSDALSTPEAMQQALEQMRSGKADMLVGTQMVAKGLDLPGVTLAAVLIADVGLSLPHFRAGERVFQILSQLTGRSGRHQAGEVILQTFRPDAPEIRAAATHEAEKFLNEELKLRVALRYPPTIPMMRFLFRGTSSESQARAFTSTLRRISNVIDPEANISCGPTFFSGGRVWQVFLRSTHCSEIIRDLPLDGVIIDSDPLETL